MRRVVQAYLAAAALLVVSWSDAALADSQRFCISGASNGVGWSWGV